MKMTPAAVFFGSAAVLFSVVLANVIIPPVVFQPRPSPNAHPYSALELRGRDIYVRNGCVYCHSQDVRPMDWGEGSGMAAQPGDYAYDSPHLIGSERNGPDLMREGGYHPDDWHWAHFENPRYTRPQSFMPSYSYIKGDDRRALIAYIQCLGGKDGIRRSDEQRRLKQVLIRYYDMGPAANVAYLNSTLPPSWFTMPNPVPVTLASVSRGAVVYTAYCAGCHGDAGDGRGPAKTFLNPPPMDFTLVQTSGSNPQTAIPGYHYNYRTNRVSVINNGAIYFAVLYGIPGSAMPQFKGQLESEKIWDVGNYIGWRFMGWPIQKINGQYNELSQIPKPRDRQTIRRARHPA